MIDLCENLKDRFAILDMPPTKDIEEVRTGAGASTARTPRFYYPVDRRRRRRRGADAHAAVGPRGRHLSRAATRSDGVPQGAGQRGDHRRDRAHARRCIDDHLGLLNAEGINALRSFPGRGIRVWGARTASDDPDVALHQRAAAVHHAAPLDRRGHAVGGVRAERPAHRGSG